MLGCAYVDCCPKNYPHVSTFAMRWEGAIAHALKAHADDLDNVHWRVLQDDDLRDAEAREAEVVVSIPPDKPKKSPRIFACMHCCYYKCGYHGAKRHLSEEHDVEDMVREEDYTWHLALRLRW